MIQLSVIVPVYRSAATLQELYDRLTATLHAAGLSYRIIFVEDRGGDDSWAFLERLAASDERVKALQLSRNFGQHAATLCGMSRAEGLWVVTLDDDLQHPPEYIPALLAKAREGHAVVYGVYAARTHSLWRNFTSALAHRVFRFAIPAMYDRFTSFRVIDRRIADAIGAFDGPFASVDGYLSWVTNDFATVTVEHAPRRHGRSGYSLPKLVRHTANLLATFSDLPVRVAAWAGVVASTIGVLSLTALAVTSSAGNAVSGLAVAIAIMLLLGGAQFLVLAGIGQYLVRINHTSSRKPLYLVSAEVDGARQHNETVRPFARSSAHVES